jgi:hypothetical protein
LDYEDKTPYLNFVRGIFQISKKFLKKNSFSKSDLSRNFWKSVISAQIWYYSRDALQWTAKQWTISLLHKFI